MSDFKPGFVGTYAGARLKAEAAHFHLCPRCGQAVDGRQPEEIAWHAAEDHRASPDFASVRVARITALLRRSPVPGVTPQSANAPLDRRAAGEKAPAAPRAEPQHSHEPPQVSGAP